MNSVTYLQQTSTADEQCGSMLYAAASGFSPQNVSRKAQVASVQRLHKLLRTACRGACRGSLPNPITLIHETGMYATGRDFDSAGTPSRT